MFGFLLFGEVCKIPRFSGRFGLVDKRRINLLYAVFNHFNQGQCFRSNFNRFVFAQHFGRHLFVHFLCRLKADFYATSLSSKDKCSLSFLCVCAFVSVCEWFLFCFTLMLSICPCFIKMVGKRTYTLSRI